MSEVRELALAHYRAFNERDFSNVSKTHSPDLVTIEPGSGTIEGIEAFMAHTQGFLTAFPDARLEILSVTEDEERAVIEGVFAGTNTGILGPPAGELPPTGRSLSMPNCDVFEAEAGRISRHRVYYDQMGFLVQLGLMPEPAAA